MEFGMPTLIEIYDLEESAKLCKELGLKFIELNMTFPQYQIAQMEEIERLRTIADKYGIYYTIHLDETMDVCNFNPLVADAYIETLQRTIEVAKKLNIPSLNMHMLNGIYVTLPDKKVCMYQEYIDSYMGAIKKLRDMAEECIGDANVRINIENTDGYLPFHKQAIEYLLESPVFGLTWDIGHSHALDNVDEPFIMENEEHLNHFHIHDGYGTKNHQTLGTGEIDLHQRLGLAKKHDCTCVLETKTIEALKQSVAWLAENYR